MTTTHEASSSRPAAAVSGKNKQALMAPQDPIGGHLNPPRVPSNRLDSSQPGRNNGPSRASPVNRSRYPRQSQSRGRSRVRRPWHRGASSSRPYRQSKSGLPQPNADAPVVLDRMPESVNAQNASPRGPQGASRDRSRKNGEYSGTTPDVVIPPARQGETIG